MKTPQKKELSLPVVVEFDDVDSYRIVHHSRFVVYLERARLRLLQVLGVSLDVNLRVVPVLYDLKLRFRRPARLLDELEVAVYVKEYDEYRLVLGYFIRKEGKTLVRATSEIAFADLDADRLVLAPQKYLDALEAYLADLGE